MVVGLVLLGYLHPPPVLLVGAIVALLAFSWQLGSWVNRSRPHG